MLSVALLVNFDGFNSAFRSEHGVMLIDLGAFANRALTAERRSSWDCPKTICASTWNHSLPMFYTMGLSRSDGCVSEVCTDLLAAFFFPSLASGVGVVGYKGVGIVNRQAITAELRRLDRTRFGRG
jgi:hypothetical protein